MRIILASSSPRRRELIGLVGLEPEVLVPSVEEERKPGESIDDFVRRVTIQKARAVYRHEFYHVPVISADTIVCIKDKILGKPANHQDASGMLRTLSNNMHEVITGIAILYQGKSYFDSAKTKVYFTRISDEEISYYLDHEDYRDKAGAYGIQGRASVFVKKIEGCYFNVVGFPLNLFYKMLKRIGIEIYR